MSKRRRETGSGRGPYVDGLAGVLTVALKRLGRGTGTAAILMATRPLGGPDDGGPAEIMCGVKPTFPPQMSILELNDEELSVAHQILQESLDDPAYENWSDLVVAIKLRPAGVMITGMPMPAARWNGAAAMRERRRYLGVPVLQRLNSLLLMVEGR